MTTSSTIHTAIEWNNVIITTKKNSDFLHTEVSTFSHTHPSFINLQELPLLSCHPSVLFSFFSLFLFHLLIHDNMSYINLCHVSIYTIIHTEHQKASQSLNIPPTTGMPKDAHNLFLLIPCGKNFKISFCCEICPHREKKKYNSEHNLIPVSAKANTLFNNEKLITFT